MTQRPRVKCPECGGRSRKMIGAGAGIIFKGSGFYSTDYRSESYKKEAKKDKASSGSKSSKSEPKKTTTDTKSKSPSGSKDSS